MNGIDQEVWNPETYKILSANHLKINFEKGKQNNYEMLYSRFDLVFTKPLFSFMVRLLYEKDANLLIHAASLALSRNFTEINSLISSSGNTEIEYQLCYLLAIFQEIIMVLVVITKT